MPELVKRDVLEEGDIVLVSNYTYDEPVLWGKIIKRRDFQLDNFIHEYEKLKLFYYNGLKERFGLIIKIR